MKDIRLDLTLFGEGEGAGETGGCAAEQSSSESAVGTDASENAEGSAKENGKSSDRMPFPEGEKNISAIKKIAFLLGLHGADEDSIIEELMARRARTLLSEKLRNRNAEKAYGELLSEAQALSEKIKGFDFGKEMSDRRFSAMLRSGLSVEEAWRAVHVEELIEEARKEAEKAAVSAALEKISYSLARPGENGGAGRAPAQSHTGVESLSGRGIRDILRRVENGAKIKF